MRDFARIILGYYTLVQIGQALAEALSADDPYSEASLML